MGSTFARALLCHSSLEWKDHTTLLDSRRTRAKMLRGNDFL
jgi:hypothetical protein